MNKNKSEPLRIVPWEKHPGYYHFIDEIDIFPHPFTAFQLLDLARKLETLRPALEQQVQEGLPKADR